MTLVTLVYFFFEGDVSKTQRCVMGTDCANKLMESLSGLEDDMLMGG